MGVWWILREGYYYVLVAFALNTGAYQAEILRGGIQSAAQGADRGGEALGLHHGQIMRKIVLPQALIVGLRPLGNELILMIKASAVASIVTVYDVMGVTRLAFSRSYDFQVYLWAALIYLLLVETIRRLWDAMEWRMTRHLRPATRGDRYARSFPMKLAFLGLGVMGFPMAGHLVDSRRPRRHRLQPHTPQGRGMGGALRGTLGADAGRGGRREPRSSSPASATTTTCAP